MPAERLVVLMEKLDTALVVLKYSTTKKQSLRSMLIHIFVILCHLVHKKLVELGLKTVYGGSTANPKFKTWCKMFMSLPFLKMDDIDDVFEELKSEKPDLGNQIDNKKFDQFITYLEKHWRIYKFKCVD